VPGRDNDLVVADRVMDGLEEKKSSCSVGAVIVAEGAVSIISSVVWCITCKEVDTKIGSVVNVSETGEVGGVSKDSMLGSLLGEGGSVGSDCSSGSKYPNVCRTPLFSVGEDEGMSVGEAGAVIWSEFMMVYSAG